VKSKKKFWGKNKKKNRFKKRADLEKKRAKLEKEHPKKGEELKKGVLRKTSESKKDQPMSARVI